jgi:hypothetical protein
MPNFFCFKLDLACGYVAMIACCIGPLLLPERSWAQIFPHPLGIQELAAKPVMDWNARSRPFDPRRFLCQKERDSGPTNASQEKLHGITTSGSGKSRDDPIVIKGAPSRGSAIRYEYTLISQEFGNETKILKQKLLFHENRYIDQIQFRSSDGDEKEIFFDITDYFSSRKK